MDSRFIDVDGLRLHLLEAGEGPAVLLLHGWPTSSFLWRDCLQPMADAGLRPIALDLPGFGKSDKPSDASYSFRFYERAINGALDVLGLPTVGFVGHDLGGPVGLYWALRNPSRVPAIALLNTLVYLRPSAALVAFLVAARLPGLRSYLTSPTGLKHAMRLGVADQSKVTAEVIAGVQEPFQTWQAREVLRRTATALHPMGIVEIGQRLPSFRGPFRVIYGERDRILPDVARTMAKVAQDVPQAEVTSLPDCGHFLQEERGAEIGQLLAAFFSSASSPPA